MDLINEKIQQYAEAHTSPETELLQQLNQETHQNIEMPQMLSGHLQGRFLSMISRMIRPKTILEIGTYTGYSAICLAEGLAEGGILHTIDVNEALKEMTMRYFEQAQVQQKIQYHIGDAREVIPNIEGNFDLVFIDADKAGYPVYYDMVIDRLSPGGWIVADNVLWSGRVAEEEKDKRTRILDDFNKKVQTDERVENILVPIRDGLMIAQKIG